jgi:sulfate/thiosulfate transport system permease protein
VLILSVKFFLATKNFLLQNRGAGLGPALSAAAATKGLRLILRRKSILPGFGLTLGYTLGYLGFVVLLPLGALGLRASGIGFDRLCALLTAPRVLAAFETSFGIALAAAAINAFFGLIVAWVLARYDFPGRRFLDAAVDLPFALPTAVAGIALAALYAPEGWIGGFLARFGITVGYTPLGIAVALIFVGLPFIVRTLQPVIADLERDVEEAAATLGASRIGTLLRVVLPVLVPALLTGFALAFARGVSEYGSVIFIAGNLPKVSEILPLLIVIKAEEYDYPGATAIALAMLIASFALLLAINLIEAWSRRRFVNG